jgi:hypothetical protein
MENRGFPQDQISVLIIREPHLRVSVRDHETPPGLGARDARACPRYWYQDPGRGNVHEVAQQIEPGVRKVSLG